MNFFQDLVRASNASEFRPLVVRLGRRPSVGGFEVVRGTVYASVTRRGDLAQLDIFQPPEDLRALPCGLEIAAAVEDLKSGRRRSTVVRLKRLPSPRPEGPILEKEGSSRGIYLRLARQEQASFTYDIVGDGSELVDYTYDGRILGLRLTQRELGVIVPTVISPQFHVEVRAMLEREHVRLDDMRPYLASIALDWETRIRQHPFTYATYPPPARLCLHRNGLGG